LNSNEIDESYLQQHNYHERRISTMLSNLRDNDENARHSIRVNRQLHLNEIDESGFK
jgi:hypothetical protein